MYKELIIVIIIIVLVITGNAISQNNTNNTVITITSQLDELKLEINGENTNKKNLEQHIKNINDTWEEKFEKMAYYIEHDELEKVSTELIKLGANIETKNYNLAIENLENCKFILDHIKDKTAIKIVNIF